MDWPTFYGLLVAAVLGITWASRNHILQQLAILLLLAWAASNFAVDYLGFSSAPLMIPSIDAAVAIMVALFGHAARSRAALVVFMLYLAVGLVHVGAFVLGLEATYGYYALLNLLFLTQLVTVGGTGARLAVRRWSAARRERPGADPARWARMG